MEKIVIFGTGNAGRAIYRAFKDSSEHEIVAFIDNNKAMVGKDYKGIPVFAVDEYKKLEFDYIAYSGVWHKDMRAQLNELGVDESKIKHIGESELVYTSPEREKAVDSAIKRLDEYFLSKDIDYYLTGGAGINVLRGRSLSCSSDVDIYVFRYDDLVFLTKDLFNYFSDLNIEILKLSKDGIIRKKGDIHSICITDNNEDKLVISISYLDVYGGCRIGEYNNKFSYMPNEIFQAGTIRQKYKDFYINMLARCDELYAKTYGENYMQIPKSWSADDYRTLVDLEELKKICFKK